METIIEVITISILTILVEEIAASGILAELYHCQKSAIVIAYLMQMMIVIATGVSSGHLITHFVHEHIAKIFSCLIFSLFSCYYARNAVLLFNSSVKDPRYSMEELSAPMLQQGWFKNFSEALWVFALAKFLSKSQLAIFVLAMNFYAMDVLVGASLSAFIFAGFCVCCADSLRRCVRPWILSLTSAILFLSYVIYDVTNFVLGDS